MHPTSPGAGSRTFCGAFPSSDAMARSTGKESLHKSSTKFAEKVDSTNVPYLTPEEERKVYRKIDLRCVLCRHKSLHVLTHASPV
jgi:hypothetical protein